MVSQGLDLDKESHERRLKVLFLPAWYPTEVKGSGGRFIREHAKAVSLYDDVVVVHAYHSPQEKIRRLYAASESVEHGIRTIRIRYRSPSGVPYSPIARLARFWSTLSYLHRFVKQWRPDVIHAHVYSAGVPALAVGKLHGIPVVVTEHWSWFAQGKLSWERRFAARFVLKRVAMVLPVSEHLRSEMGHYGIDGNFRVVPNVVNTSLFHPENRQKQGEHGTKRLLLVAVLSEGKGIAYLLHALKQVRESRQDFSLDIVGEGTNAAIRREYETLSQELGLGAAVTFHGFKRKEEVAEFMRRCDFFVLPSLAETFGIVYIEAMASGKPVVACDIPGPREFITEEVGILVPPKDPTALAKAIDFMLDHHGEYGADTVAAYTSERFSYPVVGRQLDRVYHEVARK